MTTTTQQTWNTRYLAYCRAHGHEDPEEMLADDKERYPGAHMMDFSLWLTAKWREWRKLTGKQEPHSQADHDAFDEWLKTK